MEAWVSLEPRELCAGPGFLPGLLRATEAAETAGQNKTPWNHRPPRRTVAWVASGPGDGKQGDIRSIVTRVSVRLRQKLSGA